MRSKQESDGDGPVIAIRFLTMDQTQRFGAMLVEKLCSFELPDESMLPPRSATASADGAADEHASG